MDYEADERAAAGAAAGRGGAPGGAALRLDKGTHFSGAGYRGYFVDYGEGLAEVGFGFASACRRSATARGESENREENDERSTRRARRRLRHLVLASGATYLLTLTYRENLTDIGQASADLTAFLKHVKRKYPSYCYIAVAERQQRGAWHWHLAVSGWQDIAFLRSTWLRVVGDGNIDVKPPRYGKDNLRVRLVRYLSKYLCKSLDEDHALNARRFRSSHGIEVPERRHYIPVRSFEEARDYCERWLVRIGGVVGFFVSCPKRWSGWGCTW